VVKLREATTDKINSPPVLDLLSIKRKKYSPRCQNDNFRHGYKALIQWTLGSSSWRSLALRYGRGLYILSSKRLEANSKKRRRSANGRLPLPQKEPTMTVVPLLVPLP
jgi:hypothetical protein